MRARIARLVAVIVAAALIVAMAFASLGASLADRFANRTLERGPYTASDHARAILSHTLAVDLHADTLLWSRDPGRRNTLGHVDVPRLIEGGMALEGFTIVTKVPWGLNLERNAATSPDLITLLGIAERWPPRTWRSLLERAHYQASRLRALDESRADFFLIRTREDLGRYRDLRKRNAGVTAGFLGVEGAQALQGDLSNIEVLARAGVRMIGLTHFFDTELAGSAHGESKSGLTPLGHAAIVRMEGLGVLVDLAHASAASIDDATALATRPVVVSHTGVKATCNNVRNLDDARIRAVAATGGVIGIGFWETAVCGTDAKAVARAIRHAVGVAGIEHVALGSDFDGAVSMPFDVTGVVQIVDALLAEGFDESDIAMVLGENALRVLSQVLPSEPADLQ